VAQKRHAGSAPPNLNFPPNKPEIGGGEPATYILLSCD